MSKKPLFIPLKKVHFDAFARGEKTIEYRRLDHGGFSFSSCCWGRDVVLSCGYSGARLSARVKKTYFAIDPREMDPSFMEIYVNTTGAALPFFRSLAFDKYRKIVTQLAIELEDIKPLRWERKKKQ